MQQDFLFRLMVTIFLGTMPYFQRGHKTRSLQSLGLKSCTSLKYDYLRRLKTTIPAHCCARCVGGGINYTIREKFILRDPSSSQSLVVSNDALLATRPQDNVNSELKCSFNQDSVLCCHVGSQIKSLMRHRGWNQPPAGDFEGQAFLSREVRCCETRTRSIWGRRACPFADFDSHSKCTVASYIATNGVGSNV